MIRLVQLVHNDRGRRVALVEEPQLQILSGQPSVFQLANQAMDQSTSLEQLVSTLDAVESLDYDDVYEDRSAWKILPCFDHPSDPMHCMLSGTGLTHKASAENRQKMHLAVDQGKITDSMKMYQLGVDGGRPDEGTIGVQPEWFYKGNGTMLMGHNQALEVPTYGEDGGEEPEIAGMYITNFEGQPFRVGFATANEFSDHVMERKNYLYLAPSKLRRCAIGPELVIGAEFTNVPGTVRILRDGVVTWSKTIKTGEDNIVHSLFNLEYHHFKYDNHRQPGMVHIHFMGADAFSFGENIHLNDGDIMGVYWEGFGRELKNSLRNLQQGAKPFKIPVL